MKKKYTLSIVFILLTNLTWASNKFRGGSDGEFIIALLGFLFLLALFCSNYLFVFYLGRRAVKRGQMYMAILAVCLSSIYPILFITFISNSYSDMPCWGWGQNLFTIVSFILAFLPFRYTVLSCIKVFKKDNLKKS